MLLSKDAGFSLWIRKKIRKKLTQKIYWDRLVPVMRICQSVKFEQTSDDTIIVCSNPQGEGPFYSIAIPAAVKETIISFLRNQGNSKLKALLKGFAASLALLIIRSGTGPFVFYIDEEYAKHSREIRTYLLNSMPKNLSIDKDAIQFVPRFTFSSRSSNPALAVRRGLYPVNSVVSPSEVLDLIK